MKYFVKTFGCQQNAADSERVEARLQARGMTPASSYEDADHIVINTCMVRESAENRVYGLVKNLTELKNKKPSLKIIVTGCMVGVAFRDKTGKVLKKIKKAMPGVDEFMPIEEVGFDFAPIRTSKTAAWVPISNGCNNFCTFCIVPFTRGREVSRPYEDIIEECKELRTQGYKEITLLGQNVNSYGADLIVGEKNIQVMRDLPDKTYFEEKALPKGKVPLKKSPAFIVNGRAVEPVYVQHLGRLRIPTLFPHLLEEIAQMGFERVDFVSSNPWDFSDEVIGVMARNKNITRVLHLPLQHGDNNVLKRMNRWYSREEYLSIINKIREKIPDIKFTTDIIVGFCGETREEFENTVDLCKKVGFYKAYVAMYSQRPMTAATKIMADNVPHKEKKRRWQILEELVNKPHIESYGENQYHMHKKSTYAH
ncbi:MAG: (Dimethylallyl)adenosine tRNA methylthiotransferase MiaB [Microgenomates bacterium OLB23]|nr:MAG: (Dimethylallyl)adenosine tRNA methylthiotransferase MiaB [Microgenomates bacterium OLB23]